MRIITYFAALDWLSFSTLLRFVYQDELEQKASDKPPLFRIDFQYGIRRMRR